MKSLNNTQQAVLVIGALAILASLVSLILTGFDQIDFLGLFSGTCLIGTVLIDANKKPKSPEA